MKFSIGQRVACVHGETVFGDLNGYYGHVSYIAATNEGRIIGVNLLGCTPETRQREERREPDVDHDDWFRQAQRKPWPFFERELEAID